MRRFFVFVFILFVICPLVIIGYFLGFLCEAFMSGFRDGAEVSRNWKWENE